MKEPNYNSRLVFMYFEVHAVTSLHPATHTLLCAPPRHDLCPTPSRTHTPQTLLPYSNARFWAAISHLPVVLGQPLRHPLPGRALQQRELHPPRRFGRRGAQERIDLSKKKKIRCGKVKRREAWGFHAFVHSNLWDGLQSLPGGDVMYEKVNIFCAKERYLCLVHSYVCVARDSKKAIRASTFARATQLLAIGTHVLYCTAPANPTYETCR